MLHWAAIFLIIGLIAAFLGVSGVAGTATYIAYVLLVISSFSPSSASSWASGLPHNKRNVTPRRCDRPTVLPGDG